MRAVLQALVMLLGAGLVSLGPLADVALAQYFGRNRVTYESFDFQVLKTEHFDIYHYPEEQEAAEMAARMAERWHARLTRVLNYDLKGRQPIILYASQPDFQQTTALAAEPGEATGGATEILKRRIVLPLAGPLAESDHVLGHELVHAFQFDITARTGFGAPIATQLPLWFVEGMAEYLSLGPVDAQTSMWMRDAAQEDRVPSLGELANPRFFPYRYGHALWAYIAGRWGDQMVGEILKATARTGSAIGSIAGVLEIHPDSLSRDWRQSIHSTYEPILERGRAPTDYGRHALSEEERTGRLNVSPALSPDGRRMVFLSERDRFAIEMFLANVETGEIERKIVKTALDPHFQSLQFISSAGSWHPDGRRFAFAAVSRGRPVITVLDVDRGKVVLERRIAEVGEVFNPAWSPDGRSIVFSVIDGGLSDLMILDSETGTIRRLTDDAYADLQPAWSPDGSRIAFVTDRFGSDLQQLRMGNYELALIDPESGAIERLPGFHESKNINPQWSPDGESLYFLSDRNAVTNVYRLDLADRRIRQVTDLAIGVSGIAALSPALSVAASAQRLAFSVYDAGAYDIYVVDSAQVLAGGELAPPASADPAVLPPRDRPVGDVMALLSRSEFGLPADQEIPVTDYSAGLSLDYVAPPSVGVGSDQFGTFVGGGTALYWSDMLGRRNLVTLLQVAGGFENIAAVVGYQNVRTRLNWGIVGSQFPFLTFGFRRAQAEQDGQEVLVDSTFRFRRTERQIMGFASYPFSRVQRVELSAGYRNMTFDREVDTRVLLRTTGLFLSEGEENLPAPDAAHLAQSSAALVYDNSLFGPTAPVLGQRYRLEVTPTVGTLAYYGVLADYRRYLMPIRPYTLAGRLLHFGRYGGDSDDERLNTLFLGFQPLVRGYSAGSFDIDECPVILEFQDCPVFDQLVGSRLVVANLELRLPLFQGLGWQAPPAIPPLDLAVFFDAGVAWTRSEEPSFLDGDRDPVSSYGIALRTNLFGVVILELDFVHPNDRPDKGWVWQFGFTPGF